MCSPTYLLYLPVELLYLGFPFRWLSRAPILLTLNRLLWVHWTALFLCKLRKGESGSNLKDPTHYQWKRKERNSILLLSLAKVLLPKIRCVGTGIVLTLILCYAIDAHTLTLLACAHLRAVMQYTYGQGQICAYAYTVTRVSGGMWLQNGDSVCCQCIFKPLHRVIHVCVWFQGEQFVCHVLGCLLHVGWGSGDDWYMAVVTLLLISWKVADVLLPDW